MDVYESKNSEWYFNEDPLSETNELLKQGDDQRKIINPIYADEKIIINLLRKYKIKKLKTSKAIGEAFIKELKTQTMPLDQIGGRFIGLGKQDINYYFTHTGIIEDIVQNETGEYLGLTNSSDLEGSVQNQGPASSGELMKILNAPDKERGSELGLDSSDSGEIKVQDPQEYSRIEPETNYKTPNLNSKQTKPLKEKKRGFFGMFKKK